MTQHEKMICLLEKMEYMTVSLVPKKLKHSTQNHERIRVYLWNIYGHKYYGYLWQGEGFWDLNNLLKSQQDLVKAIVEKSYDDTSDDEMHDKEKLHDKEKQGDKKCTSPRCARRAA